MKHARGFTLIEMMVVVTLIGILSAFTMIYGSRWRAEWKFSNLKNGAEAAIKMNRMQAISLATDTTLVFSDADIILSSHTLDSTKKFSSADFAAYGPWLVGTSRISYFLYNPVLYSAEPLSTQFTFNSRGLPKDYQSYTITLASKRLKKTFLIQLTPLGLIK